MTQIIDRIQGLSGSSAFKVPVQAATTGNIILNGLQTVDGVALAAGDRVLVRAQTDAVDNGVYDVATSDWQRSLDFNGAGDVVDGLLVNVIGGDTNYGLWILDAKNPIVGTSPLTFNRFGGFEDADHVVYTPSGVGAVVTTVQTKLRESVSPKDFGAVGDGIADDLAALKLSLESGYPVDGLGLTYAINGTCAPANFKGLFNANLKQIGDNSAANVQTLKLVGISDFFIKDVSINMGSNVTTLFADDGNSGIYIGGSSPSSYITNFNVSNVKVTGNGCGAGIQIRHAKHFTISDCKVFDRISGSSPDPTNDSQNGIEFINCHRWSGRSLVVHNLKTRLGGVDTVKWTRGILCAEAVDCALSGCSSSEVDQGFDFSGGYVAADGYLGNRRWSLSNCVASSCNTYGFKFANVTKEGTVVGCVASNIGTIGFVTSAPSSITAGQEKLITQNIDFVGCKVINMLGTGWSGAGATGFRVMSNATYPTYPRSICFHDCVVLDTQDTPTTLSGFVSDAAPPTYGETDYGKDVASTTIDCTVGPGIATPYSGIGPPLCVITGSGTQTIPNGTYTEISWGTEMSDTSRLHNPASNPEKIYIKKSGWYTINAQISFDTNATGVRIIRLRKNGAVLDRSTMTAAPVTGASSSIATTVPVILAAGDYISVEAYQNSGGDLDVKTNESNFNLIWIG